MSRVIGVFQMALTIPLSSFVIWFLNQYLSGKMLVGPFLHILRDMSLVAFVICLIGITAYVTVVGFARVIMGDDF